MRRRRLRARFLRCDQAPCDDALDPDRNPRMPCEPLHIAEAETMPHSSHARWEIAMRVVGWLGLGILVAIGLTWSAAVLSETVPVTSW
jgi:hypothetical protein